MAEHRKHDEGAPASLLEFARLRIARLALGDTSELLRGLERATKISAQALDVERVGIWLYTHDRRGIENVSMHSLSDPEHRLAAPLDLRLFPAYAKALETRRLIDADDASRHAATSELYATYLDPNGINSMMDAPIFRQGEVIGIVCHEHVGPKRVWTEREKDFAISVADMVGALFEQASRIDLEEKRREDSARVARAAKWEALIRFGSGVTHDFNNILGAITLSATQLARSESADDRRALAKMIEDETRRGASLVSEVLAFCRTQPQSPLDLDLVDSVRRAEHLLRALAGDVCQVDLSVPEEPLFVRADPGQIETVLLNLVKNARDAMPAGGSIGVRLGESTSQGETFVTIDVSDEGDRLDEGTRERMFEPFFRASSSSSGLNLAAVEGIVAQNRGHITVESSAERTTVRVHWPKGRRA